MKTARLFVAPTWLASVILAGQGSGRCRHGLVAYFGGSGKEEGYPDTCTILHHNQPGASVSQTHKIIQNSLSVWAPGKPGQSNPVGLGGAVLSSSNSAGRRSKAMQELKILWIWLQRCTKRSRKQNVSVSNQTIHHSWPEVPADP